MKLASWILLLMTTVMTTFNPMGRMVNATDDVVKEDMQEEESDPEKEDYASLIGVLEDMAATDVAGMTICDWDYETLKTQIENGLSNGTWNHSSNASANYTSENDQYNAASEDGTVTGFTNEETTTYQDNAYVRKTANLSSEDASLTVTDQDATAGEAESFVRYQVSLKDQENRASFSNMVYEIEDAEMQEDLLENEDGAWSYEVEFEDGSSLSFYLVQNMTETKSAGGSDPVIRTISYENGEKTIIAGFGRDSLKEITVNIAK